MITRCRLPAQQRAAKIPLTNAAFRELLASYPDKCPYPDCTPGVCCRKAVAEPLSAAWVQRNQLEGKRK